MNIYLKGDEDVSYKYCLMRNDLLASSVPATRKSTVCKIPFQISFHDFIQGKRVCSVDIAKQCGLSTKGSGFL
jgi:hypothetical protein